jgi:hypothetical protein
MEGISMMKTRRIIAATIIAAALNVSQDLVGGGVSTDLSNAAVASSPRTRERFPELTRSGAGGGTQGDQIELSKVKSNAAVASSPRTREIFPELSGVGSSAGAACPATGRTELDVVLKNDALSKSPRTLEKYPELNRGGATQAAKVPAVALAHN